MRAIALAIMLTAMAAAAEIPRPAMDIEVTLPDGKTLNVSAFRGKVVCMTFILTT